MIGQEWWSPSADELGEHSAKETSQEPVAPEIVIIDYGMGNLGSVLNAFSFLGYRARISDLRKDIESADALVLPGVGAFDEAMRNLDRREIADVIRESVLERSKPFLGICLGMQLMADWSEEGGECGGLGLISGAVRRIPTGNGLRLPHIGWNDVEVRQEAPFFKGISPGTSFYFVHSYHLECDESLIAAHCTYGAKVTAAVQYRHMFATQFHPERSQSAGLRLLRNFANVVESHAAAGSGAC